MAQHPPQLLPQSLDAESLLQLRRRDHTLFRNIVVTKQMSNIYPWGGYVVPQQNLNNRLYQHNHNGIQYNDCVKVRSSSCYTNICNGQCCYTGGCQTRIYGSMLEEKEVIKLFNLYTFCGSLIRLINK